MATSRPPERVSWEAIAETFEEEHEQGQHVAIIGPTGAGKSTLAVELLRILASRTAEDGRPARVTVLVTKPRDRTLEGLGWPRISKWPPDHGQEHVLVWPPYGDPGTASARQAAVFGSLLRRIFVEGGQTVYIDEAADFEEWPPDGMGLRALLSRFWRAARSQDISLVAGTQRPAGVSRSMWSEPDWLFIFRLEDYADLKRLREIGANRRELEAAVTELEDYEFLLVRRHGGGRRGLLVSKVAA